MLRQEHAGFARRALHLIQELPVVVPLDRSRVQAGGWLRWQLGFGLVLPPSNRLTKRRARWFSRQGSWYSV